ncbi:MAG TPA: hypothetical protein VIF62_21695 [Labilithrix sp.]
MKNRARRLFAAALACVVLVVACSLDHADLTNKACPCGDDYVCDTTRNLCVQPGALGVDGGIGCGGAGCSCATDTDCSDPDYRRCGPTKTCVGCTQSPDTCPDGSYCTSDLVCTLGCKADADCKISPASPHCDASRHQCVQCVTTTDCSNMQKCSPSGECVDGCDLDAGSTCAAGKSCCGGLCLDTTTDPLNCGACGTACSAVNGTPKCSGSNCSWTCAAGFAHCSGGSNSGCETNVKTSLTHCGSCGTNCTTQVQNANGVACNSGSCTFSTCQTNFGNCDGITSNGCDCACGQVGQICCPPLSACANGKCSGANKCTP